MTEAPLSVPVEIVATRNDLGNLGKSVKGFSASTQKDMRGAAQAVGIFSGRLAALGGAAGALTVVAVAAAVATGAVIALANAAAPLEKSLANIATLAGDAETDFNKLRKGLVGVSNAFDIPVLDVAQAQYQALSAGIRDTGDELVFLSTVAQAARAGNASLAESVTVTAAIINAYGLEVSEAEDVTDSLFVTVRDGVTTFGELANTIGPLLPQANELGVEIGTVNAAVAALTKNGFQTTRAVSALGDAFTKFIKPAEQSREIAKNLGIEFGADLVKAEGFAGALQIVADAADGDLLVLGKLFEDVNALRAVLALTGGASEDFASQLDEQANRTGAAGQALQNFERNAAQEVGKALNVLGNRFLTLGSSIRNAFGELIIFAGEQEELGKALERLGLGFDSLERLGIQTFIEAGKQSIIVLEGMATVSNKLAREFFGLAATAAVVAEELFGLNVGDSAIAFKLYADGVLTSAEALEVFGRSIDGTANKVNLAEAIHEDRLEIASEFEEIRVLIQDRLADVLGPGQALQLDLGGALNAFENDVVLGLGEVFGTIEGETREQFEKFGQEIEKIGGRVGLAESLARVLFPTNAGFADLVTSGAFEVAFDKANEAVEGGISRIESNKAGAKRAGIEVALGLLQGLVGDNPVGGGLRALKGLRFFPEGFARNLEKEIEETVADGASAAEVKETISDILAVQLASLTRETDKLLQPFGRQFRDSLEGALTADVEGTQVALDALGGTLDKLRDKGFAISATPATLLVNQLQRMEGLIVQTADGIKVLNDTATGPDGVPVAVFRELNEELDSTGERLGIIRSLSDQKITVTLDAIRFRDEVDALIDSVAEGGSILFKTEFSDANLVEGAATVISDLEQQFERIDLNAGGGLFATGATLVALEGIQAKIDGLRGDDVPLRVRLEGLGEVQDDVRRLQREFDGLAFELIPTLGADGFDALSASLETGIDTLQRQALAEKFGIPFELAPESVREAIELVREQLADPQIQAAEGLNDAGKSALETIQRFAKAQQDALQLGGELASDLSDGAGEAAIQAKSELDARLKQIAVLERITGRSFPLLIAQSKAARDLTVEEAQLQQDIADTAESNTARSDQAKQVSELIRLGSQLTGGAVEELAQVEAVRIERTAQIQAEIALAAVRGESTKLLEEALRLTQETARVESGRIVSNSVIEDRLRELDLLQQTTIGLAAEFAGIERTRLAARAATEEKLRGREAEIQKTNEAIDKAAELQRASALASRFDGGGTGRIDLLTEAFRNAEPEIQAAVAAGEDLDEVLGRIGRTALSSGEAMEVGFGEGLRRAKNELFDLSRVAEDFAFTLVTGPVDAFTDAVRSAADGSAKFGDAFKGALQGVFADLAALAARSALINTLKGIGGLAGGGEKKEGGEGKGGGLLAGLFGGGPAKGGGGAELKSAAADLKAAAAALQGSSGNFKTGAVDLSGASSTLETSAVETSGSIDEIAPTLDTGFQSGFSSFAGSIGGLFSGLFGGGAGGAGAGSFISSIFGSAIGLASGGIVPGGLSGASPVRGYAAGGPVFRRPHVAVVGEGQFDEAVVPLPDGNSIRAVVERPRESSTPATVINVSPNFILQAIDNVTGIQFIEEHIPQIAESIALGLEGESQRLQEAVSAVQQA